MDINKHPEEDDDGNGTRKNPPLSKQANKATEEDEGDGTKETLMRMMMTLKQMKARHKQNEASGVMLPLTRFSLFLKQA